VLSVVGWFGSWFLVVFGRFVAVVRWFVSASVVGSGTSQQ
jgi:hypothetical protein